MVKYIIALTIMYAILSPIMGLVCLTFDLGQADALEKVINSTFFNGGDVVTSLTWVRSLLDIILFNYIDLPGMWISIKFILWGISAGCIYGIIINVFRKTSAT